MVRAVDDAQRALRHVHAHLIEGEAGER